MFFLVGVFAQKFCQFRVGGDSLGEDDGGPGPEADEVQMRNLAEDGEVFLKGLIAVHEGVAAADEDVVDFGMLLDIVCDIPDFAADFVLCKAHHALSEAVAAVHGALVGGQDEGGLFVLVLQAGQDGVGLFAAGIKAAGLVELGDTGDAHFSDRIVRI